MIEYLKRGISDAEKASEDDKTRAVVESTLAEIEQHGDKAVRALSEKFDNYSPENFKLSPDEIQNLIAQLTPGELKDLKFAQQQVRNFAQVQRDTMLDVEVETLPGVILGHKNIPVQSVGCYVPGGKFPMVASAHMSVATASVAGVPRIIACTPPFEGKPNPGVIAAMHLGGAAFGRCSRDICNGWYSGCWCYGTRHRNDRRSTYAGRPWQRLCRGSQATTLRSSWYRSVRRANRNHGDCR